MSDKAWTLSLIACGALIICAAFILQSHDPREQTMQLKRFTQTLERAKRIDPKTEQVVKKWCVSVAEMQQPNQTLRFQQISAISRAEAALAKYDSAVGSIDAAQKRLQP